MSLKGGVGDLISTNDLLCTSGAFFAFNTQQITVRPVTSP